MNIMKMTKKLKWKSVSAVLAGGLMLFAMPGPLLAADTPPTLPQVQQMMKKVQGTVFPIGTYNSQYAPYFTGHTYLAPLTTGGVPIANVTFINGAHTFWHVHHGTCQILVAESGHGYYQIWGQEPQKLEPGQTVTIPEGVKHWHGAAPGSMFQHLSIMEPTQSSTEWMEPVSASDYQKLK